LHHPFGQTERIRAEAFTALPGRFRKKGRRKAKTYFAPDNFELNRGRSPPIRA